MPNKPLTPAKPVKAAAKPAGYSRTPLPKKLGLKSGSKVLVVGAPRDFASTLGDLPEGAVLMRSTRTAPDLIIWFVTSQRKLKSKMSTFATRLVTGSIWIAWPKKSSGVTTDLSEGEVQRVGLEAGLVDFKVCAITEVWSGLLFTRRKDYR